MLPIMAPPTIPLLTIKRNAIRLDASEWYLKALVALWDAGRWWGVDPLVLAAQCAKETSYGRFGGAVVPGMGNTCGLKIRNATGDLKDDHAVFPMADGFPIIGAVAHAHHLRLYAGFPVPIDSPDPRAVYLGPGTTNFGSAPLVALLGGRWAPAPSYGVQVEGIMAKLASTSV